MTKIVERIAIVILLALLWAMLWLAFLGTPAHAWPIDRGRHCTPYTYGGPHSCYTAPVVGSYHR